MPTSSASEWIEWQRQLERPCVPIKVGGSLSPDRNQLASAFGRVDVCLPGEHWPTWREKPLWPLCQLNLTEAPWRPNSLADIELIALFISFHFMEAEFPWLRDPGEGKGASWCLRKYPSVDALVPLVAPSHGSTIRDTQVLWSNVTPDSPTHDLLPLDLPDNLRDTYYEMNFPRIHATKLGGWPSCVQSEPWWYHQDSDDDFSFAIQIDSESEAGWMWGDSGTAYFARSQRDPRKWAFDWQCY